MVFLEEDFEAAQPRLEGVATMELLAQVRHTGRILGNFRVALGGEAWVVAVGEDNQMKLQLQSLPGSAVLVAGKPTLRQ
jgi:hypothetical protein